MLGQQAARCIPTITTHPVSDDPFVIGDEVDAESNNLIHGAEAGFFRPLNQRSYRQLTTLIQKIRQPLGPRALERGHVYVATTSWRQQSMVKVGFSGNDTAERLKSIPRKCNIQVFDAFESKQFRGAYRVEQLIHAFLQSDCHIRLNCGCEKGNREWFAVESDIAINLLMILEIWMQRQPYDLNEERLKPEWSAALTKLEASLSSQNPCTIQEFLIYGPTLRDSSPLNQTVTGAVSSPRRHSAPNTSTPTRGPRRTRASDVSIFSKRRSSFLDGRSSAGRLRFGTRSRSEGAIDQTTIQSDDGDGTEGQSHLVRFIRWAHTTFVWAISNDPDEMNQIGHIPGQWELDFDKIDLNDSSPDSPETYSPSRRSPPSSDKSVASQQLNHENLPLSNRNRRSSATREMQQIRGVHLGNRWSSYPGPEATMQEEQGERPIQQRSFSTPNSLSRQNKSEAAEASQVPSSSSTYGIASWRDPSTMFRRENDARVIIATPPSSNVMRRASLPSRSPLDRVWHPSHGIKYSSPAIPLHLPPTPESLERSVPEG